MSTLRKYRRQPIAVTTGRVVSLCLLLLSTALQAQESGRGCDFLLCVDASSHQSPVLPPSAASLRSDWRALSYSLISGFAAIEPGYDANGIKMEQVSPLTASNSPFGDNFSLLRDKAGRWLINSLNQFAPLWLILTGLSGLFIMRRRLHR